MPEPVKTADGKEVELNAAEESILDATQARLDALDTEGDEQAEQVDSTPGEKDDSQAEQVDSTPESKPADVKDEAGKETTEEVSLPDAYYRAAEHQGWKPDEIKEFFEATPELAIQTLGKIYESTNKLSDDFANIGRAKLKPADKPADAVTATQANAGKKVDLAALKEEYGAESNMVKAFEALQASIPAPAVSTGQPVQPQTQPQDVQPDPRVVTMVNQFFTADTLKPYKDFYGEGKDANSLTIQQNNNRHAVLNRADEIFAGAHAMGNVITVEQAMDLAHMIVSKPVQEKAMRAELKAKVVKRSKGLSLKPAKSKAVVPDKDAKTSEADLEAKVQARLDKTYKN